MPQGSLEQEAMDRVRRMYASFDSHPKVKERPPEQPPKTAVSKEEEPPAPQAPPQDKAVPQPTMLDVFLQDKDQSLILLLLVLLMKDGADMNLMLALLYLLL